MVEKKIVVVHAGKRDDYQVALALEEGNLLEFLVTDMYWPLDNKVCNYFMSLMGLNKIGEKNFKKGLTYKHVVISKRAFFLFVTMKIFKTTKFNPLKDELLGLKANKIARRMGCNILSMNTYGYYAFQNLPTANKILFQFHPHPLAVKQLFLEEICLYPKSATSLNKEYELTLSNKELQCLIDEPLMANLIITASSYTKNTLVEYGAAEKQIKVIPYGVDVLKFPFYNRKISKKKDPKFFNILFIGSLNQRKGILYLLEAIEKLANKNVQLLIVGRGIFDLNLLNKNTVSKVSVFNNLSQQGLVDLMHQSDVFVLPSIVEGFGQVILEAMCTGLPVIASVNSAAPDLIINNYNGFTMPLRDVNFLMNKLNFLIEHPEITLTMGENAHKNVIENYSWQIFRQKIVQTLNNNC